MTLVGIFANNPIVAGVGGFVVAAGGGLTVLFVRRRLQANDRVDEWYRNAAGIVARVQRFGHQSTAFQSGGDYGDFRAGLEPLADELQNHAASAPNGVADESRAQLLVLAAFSTGIIALSERHENLTGTEFFDAVQAHAREHYDGEYDIDEVLEFTEPALDGDPVIESDPGEIDQGAVDRFLDSLDEETRASGEFGSVDEVLGMDFGLLAETVENTEVWDEMASEVMRSYIQLAIVETAENTLEKLEERRESF